MILVAIQYEYGNIPMDDLAMVLELNETRNGHGFCACVCMCGRYDRFGVFMERNLND